MAESGIVTVLKTDVYRKVVRVRIPLSRPGLKVKIKRMKENETQDHSILLKNKLVDITRITKKIKNTKNPSLNKI